MSIFFLSSFILSASAARLGPHSSLERRAIQSEVACDASFSWSENQNSLTPCLVAAGVLGACAGGKYDVHPLSNNSVHYSFPSASDNTNTLCACSWTAYNLLQACTACQGFSASIQNWTPYIGDCDGKVPDAFLPPEIAFPEGTSIPYWAATNPSQWKDERFNLQQAQDLAAQNHADLVPGRPGEKSKSNAGPIAGGVVGGVGGVALLAGLAYFFYFRKRKMSTRQKPSPGFMDRPEAHGPSVSEFLPDKSPGVGLGYVGVATSSAPASSHTQLVQPPSLFSPLSPGTMHTHSGSAHSLSHFGVPNGSISYTDPMSHPARQMSPTSTVQMMNREDIIVPFHMAPQPHSPANDSFSAAPQVDELDNDNTPRRTRLNPPAYSPYAAARGNPGDTSSDTDRTHNRTESADTSFPSDTKSAPRTSRRESDFGSDDVTRRGSGTPVPSTTDGGSSSGARPAMTHAFSSPSVMNPDEDEIA